ncbi:MULTISPECIES: cytochrome b [unclassified Sphingomonas]|uniref:cytochrome b n=1 Tax=unclassified Sphingomonas TaxID=196159 RepID=UPI0028668421|nr:MULTISPECIES: cytochrome b [unclassified Sphingomonas]MDR6114474.1 cytochrome b561 [Sphingomonas sp. SORGH_AS_0789]MDR6148167.1 cytochrome b561 [Sphingomonas sp. SORGH_AS_0742]
MGGPVAATARYSHVAIAFHWAIAVLVVANLAIGLLHESLLPGTIPLHKAIGLTVLALTVGRILWRLGHRPPPLPAEVPAWARGSAHALHMTLYALMIVMPVSGWAMGSGRDVPRPVSWFGLFNVPPLPIGKAAAGLGHEAHEILGWAMLALVAIHVAAALRHHYLLRDGLLARMSFRTR